MEQNDWTCPEVGDSHKYCIILPRKIKVSAQKQLMLHQVWDVCSPLLWECDLSDLTDLQLKVNVVWV